MINWKKAVGITAAAAMLIPMAACGGNDNNSNGGASSSAPAETQSVNLSVWSPQEDADWLKDMEAAFEKAHPEYKVTWKNSVVSEGDAAKTVQTDPSAAADVFMFANDQLGTLQEANAIAPVNDTVAAQVKEQNDQTIVDSVTGTDGKIYGVPYTGNTYFMFYNKEYFTEEDVQTLDGRMAKAAADGKKVGFPMSNAWYFYSFFKGAGLDMTVSEDGVTNTCNWNATDTPITGVQVVEALLAITSNPGFMEADSDPFVAGVKDGTIIAGVSGTWNANTAAEVWGDNYAATKLPTFTVNGEQVQMSSFAGFKLVGVNSYSENVGDAMDFAAFMTNEESQTLRFEMRSQGPSNINAAASDAVQANPAIAALAAQSAYADVQRVGQAYWDAAAALGKIIVNGNPDNIELQTLLDNCVAGITAVGLQ